MNNFEKKLNDLYTPKLRAEFNEVEGALTKKEAVDNLHNLVQEFLGVFSDLLSTGKDYQKRNAVVNWITENNFLAKFNRYLSDMENMQYDTSAYAKVYQDLLNFTDPDHDAESLYEVGIILRDKFPKQKAT